MVRCKQERVKIRVLKSYLLGFIETLEHFLGKEEEVGKRLKLANECI
jgi:hypothetical protein